MIFKLSLSEVWEYSHTHYLNFPPSHHATLFYPTALVRFKGRKNKIQGEGRFPTSSPRANAWSALQERARGFFSTYQLRAHRPAHQL